MIAEIAAGFSSLKAALELAKTLDTVANKAAINDVRIELQGHILAAQEALAAAREADTTSAQRIRQLEQEIVRLKDWEGEKQRYQLNGIDPGAVAYVLKPGMEHGEPAHWLCPDCFNHGQRSFLQRTDTSSRTPGGGIHTSWRCNGCGHVASVFFQYSPGSPWPGGQTPEVPYTV